MAIQEQFTFQSAVTTNGNGTAADVSGLPGVCVQVEGITTASVIFEGRIGTLTYTGIQAVNLNDGSIATLTTADGLWYVPTAGLEDVRCRVSTYSGGTITVIGRAIYSPAGMTLADIDVAGAETVGIDQTTPGTTNKVTTDPITAMPTVYNVTLTNANTEYSQAMVANCRRFEFHTRTDVVIRFAFVTGKVAVPTVPWMTLKSGVAYDSGMISQGAAPSTIYLASATAGTIVEIISWV